jgi:hypothetical protein
MSALTGTNGVLTISNTTDTYGTAKAAGTEPGNVQPQALSYICSVAGHLILTDADGVTVLELYSGALSSKELDAHFFAGIRPWKAPIKAGTLTVGTKVRIYI